MSGVTAPRFGMRIPPCARLDEIAASIGDAEEAGFDTVWLPDSQFLFRDVWMALAVAATTTRHIRLATGVTNLQTRHLAVTAAALQSLEEAAPGRAVLGLGTGDSSVKTLGLAPSHLADVRQAVADLRALGRGETVPSPAGAMRLRDATGRVPPVYVAASGPKALRLAGEIADGVLVMAGVSPALVARAIACVEEGVAAAGRRRSDVDVCLGAVCYVADDEHDVIRIAKPHCAGDAQRGEVAAFEAAGVRIDGVVPQHVPGVYPDITHAEDWDHAVAVAGRWVSDEAALRYAEQFTLVGTQDALVERIGDAGRAGVDSLYLRHYRSYALPTDLIEVVGRDVIPHFAP